MICTKCGAEIRTGSKFCSKCGNRADAQPTAPAPQPSNPAQLATHQPAARPASHSTASAPDPAFNFDKLLVNQKRFSLDTAYYVYDENGNEKFFVSRKLFQLKLRFSIYSDCSKQAMMLDVTPGTFIDSILARYVVYDSAGIPVALLRRRHLISILRRTWNIYNADGSLLGFAAEDSWGKALFRRFGPFGELLKTDFIFTIGGKRIGKFIRKWTLFDKYVLDMTEDPQRALDRRIALAMCVLLDLAEAR